MFSKSISKRQCDSASLRRIMCSTMEEKDKSLDGFSVYVSSCLQSLNSFRSYTRPGGGVCCAEETHGVRLQGWWEQDRVHEWDMQENLLCLLHLQQDQEQRLQDKHAHHRWSGRSPALPQIHGHHPEEVTWRWEVRDQVQDPWAGAQSSDETFERTEEHTELVCCMNCTLHSLKILAILYRTFMNLFYKYIFH